jgi:hypothetical protein
MVVPPYVCDTAKTGQAACLGCAIAHDFEKARLAPSIDSRTTSRGR